VASFSDQCLSYVNVAVKHCMCHIANLVAVPERFACTMCVYIDMLVARQYFKGTLFCQHNHMSALTYCMIAIWKILSQQPAGKKSCRFSLCQYDADEAIYEDVSDDRRVVHVTTDGIEKDMIIPNSAYTSYYMSKMDGHQ